MKNNYGFIGGLIWISLGFVLWDGGFQKENYLVWLFLAAPLFLSACALRALGFSLLVQNSSLIMGALLALSFFFPTGHLMAILFALPWLLFAIYLAFQQIMLWWSDKHWDHRLLKCIAPLFLINGAAWALFYRAGFQPLDFNPTIVLLTAVHFHYAGLILISMASYWLQYFPKKEQYIFTYLFIIGIPLLAIGITYTHFNGPNLFETFAASWMAITTFLFALLNISYRLRQKRTIGIVLMIIASLFLMAGMTLALLFGWKEILEISWISIPWMYAVHGTINSIGFALPAVMGNSFAMREEAIEKKDYKTLANIRTV